MQDRPPVVPTCKYSHGPLLPITTDGAQRQGIQQWALLAASADGRSSFMPTAGFNVALYVCTTCGYSELFDLEPDQTAKNEEKQ